MMPTFGEGETPTLFFLKVRVDPKELSLDQLWDIWEKETGTAQKGSVTPFGMWQGKRDYIG